MDKNLETYKIGVENLAATNSKFLFSNSQPDHAAIVLTTMLKHSSKEFLIYDDNLSGDIIKNDNEDFFNSLKQYVSDGKVFKIAIKRIDDDDCKLHHTLTHLKREYPNSVFAKYADTNYSEKIDKLFGEPIYFAVGDGKSIRIENAIGQAEPLPRKAICSFNKTDFGDKLKEVFDNGFENLNDAL